MKGAQRSDFLTITDFPCNTCLEVSRYFSFFGRGETGTEVWKLRLEVTPDSCDSPNIAEKNYRKANDVNKFPSVGLPCFTHEVMFFWSWVGEKQLSFFFLMNYTSKVVNNYFCQTSSPTLFLKQVCRSSSSGEAPTYLCNLSRRANSTYVNHCRLHGMGNIANSSLVWERFPKGRKILVEP